MHRLDHALGPAIVELTGFINDPRNDRYLMVEAGLTFDPVFMPLLVRLGAMGEAGVVELAGQLGRDHSTISRQMTKLESAGLLERGSSQADGRLHTARLTPRGFDAFTDLGKARQRLLDLVLADWADKDREALGRLLLRFARALQTTAKTMQDTLPLPVADREGSLSMQASLPKTPPGRT